MSTLGADTISHGKLSQLLMIRCEKLCPLVEVLKRFLKSMSPLEHVWLVLTVKNSLCPSIPSYLIEQSGSKTRKVTCITIN